MEVELSNAIPAATVAVPGRVLKLTMAVAKVVTGCSYAEVEM